MTRKAKEAINNKVEQFLESYNRIPKTEVERRSLRSCSAYVKVMSDDLTGEIYYELVSYWTVVAIIHDDYAYDILRLVYGYTATSAQHIAKFFHDYAPCGRRDYLIERRWNP